MIVRQIHLSTMDTFCYLVGDEGSKTCALIDPAFETRKILGEAKKDGYKVTHLINTHGHPDHSAGNAAIVANTQARLHIHKLDARLLRKITHSAFAWVLGGRGSPKPDVLLEDNDLIHVGETTLKVVHTPGHTPGGICLYAKGHIFTGDTLFVGAVGRTDMPGGSHKVLLQSIHDKVYSLPEETIVWPGHNYGPAPQSTIEREKRTNIFTRA